MQDVVHSISIWPKSINQGPNKESVGLESPGLIFSTSVKGKKGIARSRALGVCMGRVEGIF